MKSSLHRLFPVLAVLAVSAPDPASAQLGRLKERVRQRVEERIGERADQAVDRAMGGNEEVSSRNPNGAAVAGNPNARPGEGAWANYDFVPGDRVIFAEDFTRDDVGDFPKRLRLKYGNLEVVEWQGGRYLSTNTGSEFAVVLPERLPSRFTIEFDYSAPGGNHMEIRFDDERYGTDVTPYINMGTWQGGVQGGGVHAIGQPAGDQFKYDDVVFPVRIMVDGEHAKVYMGDTRVANVPEVDFARGPTIRFYLPGSDQRAAMVGNLRIAAGGKELYDALFASGRVATQGILFDTNSDRIRPESTPTLKEITTMLREHADLKLVIEGHTDNVGQAAANQTLSEKRAAAVRQYLISQGIDGSRLQSKGLGAVTPAGSNDTPEGRQQNRRVELVRM